MRIIRSIAELNSVLAAAPKPAMVPTMGALHEGHLSLVRIARDSGRPVVASIFVNRLQFAPNEDFDRYPRQLARDCELLEREGCNVVFAPTEEEMYPAPSGIDTYPAPEVGNILEGQFRPGFFTGVCTVVLRLFSIVQPGIAVFGKKDYQQLVVIQQLVGQLGLPIEIIAADTVREADGLAMSSRNGYLSFAQRSQATQLRATLQRVAQALHSGECNWPRLERAACDYLLERGWKPDYVAVRRQETLQEPAEGAPLVVLAAAKLGNTRLIDNVEVAVVSAESRGEPSPRESSAAMGGPVQQALSVVSLLSRIRGAKG